MAVYKGKYIKQSDDTYTVELYTDDAISETITNVPKVNDAKSIILVLTNFILTFTSSPHIGLRISKDRLKSSKAIIFLFFAARLNIFSW